MQLMNLVTDKPAFTGKPRDLYSADVAHTQGCMDFSLSLSLILSFSYSQTDAYHSTGHKQKSGDVPFLM